jgi:hypothetical protein
MSSFIIPVKDSYGNTIYFKTSPHKGEDTVKNYESVIIWLEKHGFRPVIEKASNVVNIPLDPSTSTTRPEISHERHCATCGQVMTFKEGIAKTGKPYKAYFCINADGTRNMTHTPEWIK